ARRSPGTNSLVQRTPMLWTSRWQTEPALIGPTGSPAQAHRLRRQLCVRTCSTRSLESQVLPAASWAAGGSCALPSQRPPPFHLSVLDPATSGHVKPPRWPTREAAADARVLRGAVRCRLRFPFGPVPANDLASDR